MCYYNISDGKETSNLCRMGYKMNIRIEYNDKLSSAKLRAGRQFVYNWMVNGSQQLVIAPVCEAYIGENSVRLYASGHYFGRMGLVKVFEWGYNGKTWKYGEPAKEF